MAGYTDLAYRLTCRRLGAPLTASEMMLDQSLLRPGKLRNRLALTDSEDCPVVGQLIGNDPTSLAEAARLLPRMGFDIVDLNFACPVRKALSRRRGGHLMRRPELAADILRSVVSAVEVPVTVKLRRRFGQEDCDENFYRIAESAYQAGLAAVAVHARSVEARYSGPADWEFLARAKEHFHDRILVGSGDVRCAKRALDMLVQTGVDAVLAARGALGNPWFFEQVADIAACRPLCRPSFARQKRVMLEHYRMAEEIYGRRRTPMHMRKFGIKYARMHTRPKALRIAFVQVTSREDWQGVLDTFYTKEYEDLGYAGRDIPDAEGLG
jgi:nifR3 family TIM-barrel protein